MALRWLLLTATFGGACSNNGSDAAVGERTTLPTPALSTSALHQKTKPLDELYVTSTPDGAVTAHFLGVRPEAEPGEPAAPLSFGVERLEMSFARDARRVPFRPSGKLFFSDWSFEVFSPKGTYAALPQDRFGPYHIVAIENLKAYLEGRAAPDDVVAHGTHPQSFAPVHANLRWVSDTEIEFEAQSETTTTLRRPIGGPSRVVGTK